MNLIDFVNLEAPNIWHGRHLKQSQAKMHRFGEFQGIGFKDLKDVTAMDIHQFGLHLRSSGLTENTVDHYKAAISAILSHALDLELVDKMPNIKFAQKKPGRVRFLSEAEQEKLLAFFRGHRHWWMEHWCQIALSTGMRHDEIRGINPSMIEMRGKDICVVRLTETKNGDDRTVFLAGKAFKALAELEYTPGALYTKNTFYDSWSDARSKIAPGDKEFVFHTLRHTAATTMVNDHKLPTVTVAMQLGHRTLQTTQKYVHQKEDAAMEIAKLMGA